MSEKLRFLIFIVFMVCCWFLGRMFSFDLQTMKSWFSNFPPVLSGIVFIILFIGSTTFFWFGPKDILRVLAALIFGGWMSAIYVYFGEMGNALIMFTLSRRLGRDYVRKKFKLKDAQLDQVQSRSSLWGLLALRLNPFFPFRLLDLGTGLSTVPLKKYMLSAVIASPLRVFWIQFIIARLGEQMLENPMKMVEILAADHFVIVLSIWYFLLIMLVSVIAGMEKLFKQRKKIDVSG